MSQFIPSKSNVGILSLVNADPRFGQVRVYDEFIVTPIAMSESGYIAIYQPGGRMQTKGALGGLIPKFEEVAESLDVLHISNIIGIDLLVENKSGLGGALLGSLVSDGFTVVGYALDSKSEKSIDLQIKTTDFNRPQVIVPLHRRQTAGSILSPTSGEAFGIFKGIGRAVMNTATGKTGSRKQEIQEMLTQFDNLFHLHKPAQISSVVVQQTSDADELAKYKKLLDDGTITQDEFNAKKKQILGI